MNAKIADPSSFEIGQVSDTIAQPMVLPVKRWFAVAFLASAIAISQETASAADAWKIIKVRGSDYLSVENISQFYGLPSGIAASAEIGRASCRERVLTDV